MEQSTHQKNDPLKPILIGIIIVVCAIIIFRAGMFVGYHKAAFSYRLGDNYYRTFENGKHSMMQDFSDNRLETSNGAVGKIIKINLPEIVVATPNNTEKTILVTDDTLIRRFREATSTQALTIDNFVVVIGSPNPNGQIVAKVVRIVPPPTK